MITLYGDMSMVGLYHSVSMVNLLRQYHGFDVRKTIYNLFNSNKYYNAKY